MDLQEPYNTAATELADTLRAAVAQRAVIVGVSYEGMLKAVLLCLETQAKDGRAIEWRLRLRLYGAEDGYETPEADTDPDRAADAAGAECVKGLPAIVEFVAGTAARYHGAACAGLDTHTLHRKIRSLRTQISNRGDGTGRLVADYQVAHNGVGRAMRAACDVVRVTGDEAPERRLPGGHRSEGEK